MVRSKDDRSPTQDSDDDDANNRWQKQRRDGAIADYGHKATVVDKGVIEGFVTISQTTALLSGRQ